ncbi:unnamed protein product [Victoria cruziana]
MKGARRNRDGGFLREITNPLQNSKSVEAGGVSIVGKEITKSPGKQSKNSPVTKNSSKQRKNSHHGISKAGRENIPPTDQNVPPSTAVLPSPAETIQECDPRNEPAISATPDVQVAVRIRPLNAREESNGRAVRKVSSDSLLFGDKTFRFDSISDSDATQEDVFHQVGAPLVKNSLAGFNTTLLLYGQTGSGKTYTIWGPQSAIICDTVANNLHRGIAPRFFEKLFSEIQKEKENCGDKQLTYQCRCSFLEVYNEQITDLLDPTKRNLQFKEDVKNGVYVENLTEECITNMDDVNNVLIKGLSNRRVGATSMNSKSSRSHIVLTCLIESWCKEMSSTWFSSSKCSRTNFIDLAGSEKQKLVDASHQFMVEYKNVKQSLSYLGNVVKVVADRSQSGNTKRIPYRCSSLTYLLQDSIGGNTKLTVLCTVSPEERYYADTSSTLRFGQQARAIQNKATVNEITEDDVSNLSDQIRQLKEELIRVKSSTNSSIGNNCKHLRAWDTRESLNRLRLSLNHSIMLSQVDMVQDEEDSLEEDVAELSNEEESLEDDVAELCNHLHKLCSSSDENAYDMASSSNQTICTSQTTNDYMHEENDHSSKESSYSIQGPVEIIGVHDPFITQKEDITKTIGKEAPDEVLDNSGSSTRLMVNPCRASCILREPTESTSPRITDQKTKGLTSQILSNHNYCSIETASLNPKVPKVHESEFQQENYGPSTSIRSSRNLLSPTEYLAASLQHGMQILDSHRGDSATRKSSSFSFMKLSQKPFDPQKSTELDNKCSSPSVTMNSSGVKASENKALALLANASDKKNLLADASSDQAVTNEQLSLLYEQEREQNLQLINSQKDEIRRLVGLLSANLMSNVGSEAIGHPPAEYKCKILNDDLDNLPPVKKANSDLDKLKMELDSKYRASRGLTEEAFLQEIEDLRNQLQSYIEGRENSQKETPLLLQSAHLRESICVEPTTDASLSTKGLRIDLERSRSLAERKELELDLEKKSSNELNDALQRAIQGHAKIIEQYADLQDNYTTLLSRHRRIMEGIEQMKRVASKAGKKGAGSILAESLAAELSALRFEKDKEKDHLQKENRRLKIQLKDTAEAVQAAGELLVRLKEAEAAATNAEERCENSRQEVELMKRRIEKLEKKHVKELDLLKAQLANSRLPESALEPLFQQQTDRLHRQHEDWGQDFIPYCHDRDGIFSSTGNQMNSESNTRNTIWEKWNESAAQY